MHRVWLLMLVIATVTVSPTWAADIIPAPEPPAAPEGQPPVEGSQSEVAPSPRDQGMVKQPETVPHPDSVVTPPVVDPKMAINPEAASPQPVEPPERPNEDRPQKKQ
jgi:hypothetical protein